MAATIAKVLESREACKSGILYKICLRASSESIKEFDMEMETSTQAENNS